MTQMSKAEEREHVAEVLKMSPEKGKMSAENAHLALGKKMGRTMLRGWRVPAAYYSVGVEVPPRRGASFSMRYTTVPSIKAGWRLLQSKMARKKVGMIGELVLFSMSGGHSVGLGGFIRRKGGVLEEFPGDPERGALYRERSLKGARR